MVGNIVIEGVVSSCYALYNYDVAHIALTPIRLLPRFTEWVFGNDMGGQTFVEIAKYLGNFALPLLQSY